MRIKIVNNTSYQTRPLRPIITRVIREELTGCFTVVRVTLRETVRGRSEGGLVGRAGIGQPWMILWLPKNASRFDPLAFAHSVSHEAAHCRGLKHRHMRGNPRYAWVEGWREIFGWAQGVILLSKFRPTQRPTTAGKLARAQVNVSKWETRIKRANTMLRKWKVRERYYGKKLTVAASGVETGHLTPRIDLRYTRRGGGRWQSSAVT